MKKNFYAKKLDLNKQTVTNLRSGEMLKIYGGKALKNIQTNGNPSMSMRREKPISATWSPFSPIRNMGIHHSRFSLSMPKMVKSLTFMIC